MIINKSVDGFGCEILKKGQYTGDDKYVYIIPTTSNNRILLSRKKDKNTFEAPGGHIEARESIMHAAIRELYEETGIKISSEHMEHIFDYHAFTGSNPRGAYSAVFRVNITDTMLVEPPKEFEMCECKLFDTLPGQEYLSYPTIAQTVYDYYEENFLGKVDFYLHSCNSDGENTVEEICELASSQTKSHERRH